MGWMMGAMLFWTAVCLLVLVLAVVGGVWLAHGLGDRRGRDVKELDPGMTEEPREILGRRYAKGEIDEDEYLRRLAGLSQS